MNALRSWPVWLSLATGTLLLALTAHHPGIAWTLLLWMIPTGTAIGQARHTTRPRRHH